MNFEPQKFFIGLIDFFSVLLPGALLTYVGRYLLENTYPTLDKVDGLLPFIFSSYLLGHFVFLIGSWLLDDWYDAIRKATYERQIALLSEGKKLSARLERWLAARLFKKDDDKTVNLTVKIKEYYLDPLKASSAINAFQWCKARLTLKHSEAIATVQRFEADSKFFRSFVVVLSILALWSLLKNKPEITIFSALLIPLAIWRYVDQRRKAVNQAYWYVITLEGQDEKGFRYPPNQKTSGASHAGGVVYQWVGNQVKYLLVQATKDSEEWVLPKGHIEPGEKMIETAVREVREETGVWARINSELKHTIFQVDGEPIGIQFYLMEKLEEHSPIESRKHEWLPFRDAISKASHKESKDLLRLAENKLMSNPGGLLDEQQTR